MAPPPDPLDAFDRQILDLMQRACQRKAEAIASQIGLSASAVQRRLKRLRAQGVIAAEVAVLDRQAVGPSLTLVAGLEIERDNYAALARFRAWAAQEDALQQVYYATGQTDLVAIVTARDMPAYDAFCARLMAQHPSIRRINTQVVIDVLKAGLQVPVQGVTPSSQASEPPP